MNEMANNQALIKCVCVCVCVCVCAEMKISTYNEKLDV